MSSASPTPPAKQHNSINHSNNYTNTAVFLIAVSSLIVGLLSGAAGFRAALQLQARRISTKAAHTAVNLVPADTGAVIDVAATAASSLSSPSPSDAEASITSEDSRQIRGPPADTVYSRTKKDQRIKLILLVRTDLGMGKGKIAAQAAHAAVGIYSQLVENEQDDLLDTWEENGQAKICLKVNSEEELQQVVDAADALGIETYTVHDAGHTQVAANTMTVAAIGPGPAFLIDQVTGKLKLLG